MIAFDIDHATIERRKEHRRRVWDYLPVDHVPVMLWPMHSFGTTLREQCEDGDVQFMVNVETIKKVLKTIPDDYIPFARVWQGYMTVATMFGVPVHWSDDPNQAPGVAEHPIRDLEQVYALPQPTLADGFMPENRRRLRRLAAEMPRDVYVIGIDNGGPLNHAKDLLETNLLYTGFRDNPAAMHHLLDLVTQVQLEVCYALIEAVGGDINRMTCVDFDPDRAPEKYKSFCSDDVCATIGPATFREFAIPHNSRIYQPWGSGLLHNCGPHPYKWQCLEHTPRVKGLNCSYHYSRAEFPELRKVFAGWGIVQVMFDLGETAEEMIAGFRYMMETLAPDAIGIPICMLDDSWSDSDITTLYWEMRKIGDEYARNIRWVGPIGLSENDAR